MREVLSILRGPMPMGRLDRAALEIAAIEHPGLMAEPWLDELDEHARALGARVGNDASGEEFIDEAARYFAVDCGFRGAAADYYDPRNSCLNDVLETRAGLPITLSIVYMEVARRLARPVYGVGLPGHFLALYDDGETSAWIDPFHGWVRRTAEECHDLARPASGPVASCRPSLAAVTHRHIVTRMLTNLRAAYLRRHNFRGVRRVLDCVLEAFPESHEDVKLRGAILARLGDLNGARRDFERYLELAPRDAPDRGEMERQVRLLARNLAERN